MIDQRGTDVDHDPGLLFQHLWNNGLCSKEGSLQIGIQKAVEVSFIYFQECLGFIDACVIYQHIYGTKSFHSAF
ncbi:hypothetical protein D3C86_1489300 [compost metagenome]